MELAQYLFSQITAGALDQDQGRRYLQEVLPTEIAVVGMSCEYTGAPDVFAFEELLRSGRNGFKPFPQDRRKYFPLDHRYLIDAARGYGHDPEELFTRMCDQQGSYLEGVDQFEPGFFDIPELEATYIDPMHRLVLKHLHLAIEHSGMTREEIYGSRTAIYVGKDRSIAGNYQSEIENDSDLVNPGTWEGILASRLNYLYDLQGGSLVVDTACSSSLVALHVAKKMLRDNEIDIALVGGIALGLAPRQGEVFGDYASVETKRDYLKVFDQASSGTIFGEGVGFVMLRRLPDAVDRGDKVYSLVRATGINSDGKSNGLTAPNPKAQTNLIKETYAAAGISPATIDYVDAHGTGTKLGDPIEIRGLTDAFRGGGMTAYSTCALSSLKENIGHTVGAAGVAGLIKMSLALDSQLIYPASGFEVPNDFIKFIDTPFYVPDTLSEWERRDHPRRGAISGFGFSGTNGHAVLEEYAAPSRDLDAGLTLPFLLSAPTAGQLSKVIDGFLAHAPLVAENPLVDISYTLVRRRKRYAAEVGFVAATFEEFLAKLGAAKAVLDGGEDAELSVRLPGAGASSTESRAMAVLRKRIAQMPDLFSIAERVELAVADNADLFCDSDFPQGRVCGLPGHVFDTKAYWGTVKKYNVYETEPELPGTPVGGQLIDAKILSTPSVDLYSIKLDLDRWFLRDHQIAGTPTMSGTAYTQIAAEVAQLYFGTPAYELSKMMFKNLVQVTGPRTILVEVTRGKDESLSVEVFSQTDDAANPFVAHGSFVLNPLRVEAVDPGPGPTDLGAAAERFAWKSDIENSQGMRFSGRWDLALNDMAYERRDWNDHIIRFALHEGFRDDLTDFHISPSILDLVAGVISWERSMATGKTYLPFSYGKLRFTGARMTPVVLSRTSLRYAEDADPTIASGDVWVYNEDGELVVHLERYSMRAFLGATEDPVTYHQVVLEPITFPEPVPAPASLLLVGDAEATAAALAGLPEDLAAVTTVTTPEQMEGGERVETILYLPPAAEATDLDAVQAGMASYLAVAKGAARRLTPGGRLVVLAANALAPHGVPVNPLAYAIFSSARVISMENPRVAVTAISDADLDVVRAVGLGRAEELAGRKVLLSGDSLFDEAVRPHPTQLRQRLIAPDSTVLVTGGFGGIGLEYVETLWREYQAHSVVFGRRGLADLAASDNEHDHARAARLQALEAEGMRLRFVRCDLADPGQVAAAVAGLREDGVTLRGVVHFAGVPDDGMLFRKEAADLERVTGPKALAAIALLRELDGVDFFLAASTMTTITGGAGAFGYTVANAYLEGLARAGTGVSTVRWPGWKETGMALAFGVADAADDAFLIRSLPTAEGLEYVRRSLDGVFTDLIAGDFTPAAAQMLTPYVRFGAGEAAPAAETDAAPAAEAPSAGAGEAPPAGMVIRDFAALTITGTNRELDDLEKFIAVLFATVLEREAIDVSVSFTDMGGDSLKAFSIYTPLVDRLGVDLEVADIFIYSTVLELSEHVRELQGA
ncbi:MAG: SDR family NAD(P)-dependent oxidoreductase [Dermatophilaceae bacterium]